MPTYLCRSSHRWPESHTGWECFTTIQNTQDPETALGIHLDCLSAALPPPSPGEESEDREDREEAELQAGADDLEPDVSPDDENTAILKGAEHPTVDNTWILQPNEDTSWAHIILQISP